MVVLGREDTSKLYWVGTRGGSNVSHRRVPLEQCHLLLEARCDCKERKIGGAMHTHKVERLTTVQNPMSGSFLEVLCAQNQLCVAGAQKAPIGVMKLGIVMQNLSTIKIKWHLLFSPTYHCANVHLSYFSVIATLLQLYFLLVWPSL